MTTHQTVAGTRLDRRPATSQDSTAGLAVAALLLALVLGFSAADIHRHAPAAGPVMSSDGEAAMLDGRGLDGRGKWAGYLD